jgi:hypothetical protein
VAYILDSGFVYAQLNKKDKWYDKVSATSLVAEREPLILPIPAISEITFLLNRNLGNNAVATFVESLADTDLILEPPNRQDFLRSAEVLRK